MTGQVTRLVRDRGFGFIGGDNGTEYFFHRSECALDGAGAFDNLVDGLRGSIVEFDEQLHEKKGMRATKVRLVTVR